MKNSKFNKLKNLRNQKLRIKQRKKLLKSFKMKKTLKNKHHCLNNLKKIKKLRY